MINLSDKLKDKLNSIPDFPGIYKMLDKSGRIIYIGKSISLRSRTRSYFTGQNKWGKIEKMVSLIDDIEYEVTDTHLEARLRECKLIKDLQPIFNAQFKNDKKYIYLKVEDYNIYRPLSLVYDREAGSYGPFRSRSLLMEVIESLNNLYPIIREKEVFDFDYKILPVKMDMDVFSKNKKSLDGIFSDARAFQLFIDKLDCEMKSASSDYKFERAIYYRNLINRLKYIQNTISINKEILERDLILKIGIQNGHKLFYIKKGNVINKEIYHSLGLADIDKFSKRSKDLSLKSCYLDEKRRMDFANIIYSEIKSLGEESVIYLE